MTKADKLIARAFADLKISEDSSAEQKFSNVYSIVAKLQEYNKKETINVGTTGTITERICEWALISVGENYFYRLTGNQVKWLGDYALLGYPLNIIVSVKSFTAKERLLMSGTGSPLAPTIGFGLFHDPTEFKKARLVSYRMRGFLSIYCPNYTYDKLTQESKEFTNWNGSLLMRKIEDFPSDLSRSMKVVKLGKNSMNFIDPLLI